jgi:hypothetical protein
VTKNIDITSPINLSLWYNLFPGAILMMFTKIDYLMPVKHPAGTQDLEALEKSTCVTFLTNLNENKEFTGAYS